MPWAADADFIHWNQVRAAMLWCLDSALSLFGKGQRPFLARHEASQGTALLQLHLELWQRIARRFLLRKQTLYKVRPKHHYLCHLILDVERNGINPIFFANFAEEDFMKFMRSCAHASHPRTMLTAWSARYILKRSLTWRRLQSEKTVARLARLLNPEHRASHCMPDRARLSAIMLYILIHVYIYINTYMCTTVAYE